MRKLNQSELFTATIKGADQRAMEDAILSKINVGHNVITPEHLGPELLKLKNNVRRSGSGILGEAIASFENEGGFLNLVNLTDNNGRSVIPATIPFMIVPSTVGGVAQRPVILMNTHRIGRFTNDGTEYTGLSANTDLFALLESGVVMFQLLVEDKYEKLTTNQRLLESLTRIYTKMFAQAIVKTSSISLGGVGSFNNELVTFLTSKFFLKYVLELKSDQVVDTLSFKLTNRTQTLDALKLYEESASIDYTSLTSFLETLGESVFGIKLSIHKFSLQWISMFGEGTLFAIEYAPFFIHFLLSARVGAYLGGNSRLVGYRNQLEKDGLPKFYNELISTIR